MQRTFTLLRKLFLTKTNKIMTIIQMQDLGNTGEDLLEKLEELKDSLKEIETVSFITKSEFKELEDLQSYIGETVEQVEEYLVKLKEK